MDIPINWLLEHAGPVIKYRVLNELCDDVNENDKQAALAMLLELPEMQKRLIQLKNQDLDELHGATFNCFENSLPMVLDFGLSRGIPAFDQCIDIEKIIGYYEALASESPQKRYFQLEMYPLLLKAGFRNPEILNFISKRIDFVSSFTEKMNFDIYDDIEKHKGMPKTYRDRPVVKSELWVNSEFMLPMIYDIIGFAEMYKISNTETQEKINKIIRYILTPEYHNFTHFYGIMRRPDKRYQAIGWDCQLPFFNSDSEIQLTASAAMKMFASLSMYLHRLEMFSEFPIAAQSSWYQKAMAYFDQFITDHDTYILSKEYLEESDHCWFLGNHMSLGENRRKSYQEAESTFRIIKIKRNMVLGASSNKS